MDLGPFIEKGLTVGGVGVWTLVALILATMVKIWPVLKQRANEARQIELEDDAKLRGDLLKRISDLEHSLSHERTRCEEALTSLRREMQAKYDGLMRQFLTAQMAWAQAIPPSRRSPEIDQMLDQLKAVGENDGEKPEGHKHDH